MRITSHATPNRGRRLVLTMSLVLALASPATAQIPGLPGIPGIPGIGSIFGGPTVVIDPTAIGKLVQQIRSQLQQIDMQRRQLQEQVVAMQKLRNPNWRQVAAALNQMDLLMQQGQSLAYSLRGIDAEFRRTFPGVQVFRNFPVEEGTQATRTLATLRGALNAASRATQDFGAGLSRLDAMKRQVSTIRGHEEALELNATISVYGAEELMLLRQALAAQTNVQAVYYANQVNALAQERATVRANLAALAVPGRQSAPYSLQVAP